MARPKGLKHTEETKQKMREWHQANPEHNKYWLGKKMTAETKKKMSESNHRMTTRKGQRWGEEERKRRLPNLHRGENHWEWKKDRTQVVQRTRQEMEELPYKEWRNKVLQRDNYLCKISNSDCIDFLEVHHILSWGEYPELRYEITNGITLCRKHHPRGRKNEIKMQAEFLSLIKELTNTL